MSFLDKLKKSMGVEELQEESLKVKRIQKTKKPAISELKPENEPLTVTEPLADHKPLAKKEELAEDKKKWFEPEGQLAMDVYQTETDLIIQSAIAGIKPENLDITMERDIITIRGVRGRPFEEERDYFIQECYWGAFSREVILPVEIDPDRTEASMKQGILTIRIPKILREKKRSIEVKG